VRRRGGPPQGPRDADRGPGRLADRPWRLTVVGNRTRAAAHAAALEGLAAELGLSSRVEFAGELEDADLAPLWLGADLYVSASAFEGYGSALAEAWPRACRW
jgi:glycosyltransferase involved in cell wall biosynthesis